MHLYIEWICFTEIVSDWIIKNYQKYRGEMIAIRWLCNIANSICIITIINVKSIEKIIYNTRAAILYLQMLPVHVYLFITARALILKIVYSNISLISTNSK